MSRCPNCGWGNPTGISVCEKCGTAVAAGSAPPPAPPSVERPPIPPPPSSNSSVAGTMIGQRANMDAWDAAQSPPAPQSPAPRPPAPPPPIPKADASGGDNKDFRRCPSASCNYLNLAKAKFCVACGMELTAAKGRPTVQQPDAPQQQPPPPPRRPRGNEETQRDVVIEPQEEVAPARPASSPSEPAAAPRQRPVAPSNVNATVNPWSKRKQASFTLHPLSREGEPLKEALSFEGTTELNRANMDPANTTITSKIQAVIEHRDGQWYIANESALQTTFIRVDEPTPLKKGDVILMGDRLFQFSEED